MNYELRIMIMNISRINGWLKVVMVLFALHFSLLTVDAQPKARRAAQAAKKQQSSQGQLTRRAQLMFPTAIDMPEDVVWRRDIYRELDLNKDANAALYYPVEPIGRQLNLFTYLFKLALNNYIKVYEYRLDGNEAFDDSARVDMKTILDNFHIYYEEKDGKLRVDNSDIPSADVKMYYIKESAYYDQANSSFRRKVLALCPVMMREDDFGGAASKYPLFWVKYSDVEPFLSRQSVMTSNFNNAATMGMDDYFTLTKFDGKIYKTNNMLGRTLAQYCPTDSAMAKEQKRIEAELKKFEENIFGDKAKKDSLDSIAKLDPKAARAAEKIAKKNRRTAGNDDKEKVSKKPKTRSTSSSSSARVSVRRQRR